MAISLQKGGNVAIREMYRTFNCGIGMVAVVASGDALMVREALEKAGETTFIIGELCAHAGNGERVTYSDNLCAA